MASTIRERFNHWFLQIGQPNELSSDTLEETLFDAFRAGIADGKEMQKALTLQHFARVYPSQEKPRR